MAKNALARTHVSTKTNFRPLNPSLLSAVVMAGNYLNVTTWARPPNNLLRFRRLSGDVYLENEIWRTSDPAIKKEKYPNNEKVL